MTHILLPTAPGSEGGWGPGRHCSGDRDQHLGLVLSAEAPTSLNPLAFKASGFAALSDNVKEVVPCVCPTEGPALAPVPSMPVLSVTVAKPMCEANCGVLGPSHCHRVGAGTRVPSTSCQCPFLAIPFARTDPWSRVGAVGPVAPCPPPCRQGGEGWCYQPLLCGGAGGCAGRCALSACAVHGCVPATLTAGR